MAYDEERTACEIAHRDQQESEARGFSVYLALQLAREKQLRALVPQWPKKFRATRRAADALREQLGLCPLALTLDQTEDRLQELNAHISHSLEIFDEALRSGSNAECKQAALGALNQIRDHFLVEASRVGGFPLGEE